MIVCLSKFFILPPDLFYETDPNPELKGTKECIIGPSKRTFTPSKEWRLQNNYTKDRRFIYYAFVFE